MAYSLQRTFSPAPGHEDAMVDTANLTQEEALVEICLHGKYKDAKYLLKHGADPNFETVDQFEDHQTPLGNAVWRGHKKLIQLLLDHGADPDIIDGMSGGPLVEALTEIDTITTHMLLRHGANPNILIELDYNPLRRPTDEPLYSPMHRALGPRCLSTKFLNLLYRFGGDFTLQIKGRGTPLHELAREGGGVQEIEKLRFCVLKGVDVNVRDEDGYTALETAVRCNKKDTLAAMLSLNKFKRSDRHRCLHLAAEAGHIEAADCLWDTTRIDIHELCKGSTAIQVASDNGQWQMVDWLMAHGAGKKRRHSKSTCHCENKPALQESDKGNLNSNVNA